MLFSMKVKIDILWCPSYACDMWKSDKVFLFFYLWCSEAEHAGGVGTNTNQQFDLRKSFCAAKQKVPAAWTTRVGTIHSCEVLSKSDQHFDLGKSNKVFYFFSSSSHFVQPSGTCQRHWKLWWVLITPVQLGRNQASRKAGWCFSIFGSGGHFVQPSGKCQWHAQLGLVLITPVKGQQFHMWNQTRFFYF